MTICTPLRMNWNSLPSNQCHTGLDWTNKPEFLLPFHLIATKNGWILQSIYHRIQLGLKFIHVNHHKLLENQEITIDQSLIIYLFFFLLFKFVTE